MQDADFARVAQLSLSIKRVVDMWVDIRQVVNVGMAADLVNAYEVMMPSDEDYDTAGVAAADAVLKNW